MRRDRPGQVSLPIFPTYDFLWPTPSVIVSARVLDFLCEGRATGFELRRMVWRKVGWRAPRLPAPYPWDGEPSSSVTESISCLRVPRFPDYFEIFVTAECDPPPGLARGETCELCGFREDDLRGLTMDPGRWRGDDVFHLYGTRVILVTDALKRRFQAAGFTNPSFGAASVAGYR